MCRKYSLPYTNKPMLPIKMQNVDKVFMALAKTIKFGTFKYILFVY